jgi:hypothetical protein
MNWNSLIDTLNMKFSVSVQLSSGEGIFCPDNEVLDLDTLCRANPPIAESDLERSALEDAECQESYFDVLRGAFRCEAQLLAADVPHLASGPEMAIDVVRGPDGRTYLFDPGLNDDAREVGSGSLIALLPEVLDEETRRGIVRELVLNEADAFGYGAGFLEGNSITVLTQIGLNDSEALSLLWEYVNGPVCDYYMSWSEAGHSPSPKQRAELLLALLARIRGRPVSRIPIEIRKALSS